MRMNLSQLVDLLFQKIQQGRLTLDEARLILCYSGLEHLEAKLLKMLFLSGGMLVERPDRVYFHGGNVQSACLPGQTAPQPAFTVQPTPTPQLPPPEPAGPLPGGEEGQSGAPDGSDFYAKVADPPRLVKRWGEMLAKWSEYAQPAQRAKRPIDAVVDLGKLVAVEDPLAAWYGVESRRTVENFERTIVEAAWIVAITVLVGPASGLTAASKLLLNTYRDEEDVVQALDNISYLVTGGAV